MLLNLEIGLAYVAVNCLFIALSIIGFLMVKNVDKTFCGTVPYGKQILKISGSFLIFFSLICLILTDMQIFGLIVIV